MKKRIEKILVIQHSLAPYRIDLFNYLAEHYDVKVVFWFREAPEQKFNQDVLKKNVKFNYEYLDTGFTVGGRVIKLDFFPRLFRFKPDLILADEFGFFTLSSIVLKKLLKFKILVACDDSPGFALHPSAFKLWLKKFVIRHTEGVITISPEVSAIFERKYNATGKVFDLPIMYKEDPFRDKLTEARALAEEYVERYNLSYKKVLLFVGRLVGLKGLDFLLRSFKKMLKDGGNYVLVIIGDGEEGMALRALTRELGLEENVRFPGRFDGIELMAWYLVGQVFVLPSRIERYGAVVNEALIAGMPVLCSNIAGAATLINGHNGALFTPDAEDQLPPLMESFLDRMPSLNGAGLPFRDSLMPYSFQSKVERFKRHIDTLSG